MTQAKAAAAGRRAWYHFKIWAAVKDMPEVAILAGLVGGVVGLAGYTGYHIYFTPAGGAFPSPATRGDIEKQVDAAARWAEQPWRSPMHRVAESRTGERGYNMRLPGLWSNSLAAEDASPAEREAARGGNGAQDQMKPNYYS
ncbi:MAG: hypothetical protein WDW38_009560 [Sanguina aurantia]